MSIEKFRTEWRNSPQKQLNYLEAMVKHLANISNTLVDISVKLDALPRIEKLIEKQTDLIENNNVLLADNNQLLEYNNKLLGAVMDNTSCTCNALADSNNKLDEIIDLLKRPPTPEPGGEYIFWMDNNHYTITQEDIEVAGSFNMDGISTKNDIEFNEVSIINCPDWLYPNVYAGTIGMFNFLFTEGANVPEGDTALELRQAESNKILSITLTYKKPAPVLYSLLYDYDGGVVSGSDPSGSYAAGTHLVLPHCSKSGFLLKGYASSFWTGLKAAYSSFDMPAEAVSVKATWEAVFKGIKIKNKLGYNARFLVAPAGFESPELPTNTKYQLKNDEVSAAILTDTILDDLIEGDSYTIFYSLQSDLDYQYSGRFEVSSLAFGTIYEVS